MSHVIVSGGRPTRISAATGWPLPSTQSYEHWSATRYAMPLLTARRWATYEQMVERQPWVFSAVSRLCFWHARIPMKVYLGERTDERERLYEGALPILVKQPNPKMRYNRFIRDQVAWDFYVHGKSISIKARTSAGAPPSELWPVPWKFVTEVQDEADRPIAYEVWLGASVTRLTPDQVFCIGWPRGIGPVQALARTLGIDDAAMTYQAEALRNGIMPRAAFTMPHVQGWTPKPLDLERLRKELDKLYAGPDAAGNYVLLHDGLTYDKPIGVTPVDLALIEQRKLSREEICAAFDITPPFLGILDRATFSNVTELREAQYRDSLAPKIAALDSDFQTQVVDPEPVWANARLYVESDMDAILRGAPEAQARQDLMEQQSSTTSIDERRRRRNERPFAISGVTDVPLIPANMIPAGAPRPAVASGPAALAERTLLDELVLEAVRAGRGNGHPPEGDDDDE